MGPDETPVTIPAGKTEGEFAWDGLNWWGPSDTGNEPGLPFPVGDYTLTVSAEGRVDGVNFEIRNEFLVVLTD